MEASDLPPWIKGRDGLSSELGAALRHTCAHVRQHRCGREEGKSFWISSNTERTGPELEGAAELLKF